jgi:glutamate synthase (NADPH/NADH) small chain
MEDGYLFQFKAVKQFIPADEVVIAFGFRSSPANWFDDFKIHIDKSGLVVAPEKQELKFQTSNPKIFSGWRYGQRV